MRWIVLLAGALALAGCQTDGGVPAQVAKPPPVPSSAEIERMPGYVRPSDAQAIASAKQAVAVKMKDPDSARFADLSRMTSPNANGEPTDVVCGMVNAKNSYGGYTGASPFVYFVGDKSAVSAEQFLGADVIARFCPPRGR